MSKIIIKSVEYLDSVTYTITGPLGDQGAVMRVIDVVILTVDIGDNPMASEDPTVFNTADHKIQFAPEAIADRMVVYGLATPELALEALARELVFRIMPTLAPTDPADPIHVAGGVDERITSSWAKGAAASASPVLAQHADRIETARKLFAGEVDESPAVPKANNETWLEAAPTELKATDPTPAPEATEAPTPA